MTSSTELLDISEVALAAYANLAAGTPSSVANIASLKLAGFTSKQAAEFANRSPNVILPTYHDLASDLDVTVFKDASGNLTLGIRGTLPGHDLTVTDQDIGLYGAGYDQIVALYNWWKKVSTPAGQQVDQFALVEYPNATTVSPPSEAVKLYPTSLAFGGKSIYLAPVSSIDATGELTAALSSDPDHKIDVTGHSLGGHLALAFNTLFGASVGQAVGFDAPGFIDGTINQQFFAALHGSAPTSANADSFINVIADEAGIGNKPFNAIAGMWSRPGVAVDIGIENQWLSDEPMPESVINHSMKMLTDSLAVFNLLATLDPSLSTSRYKLLLSGAASGTAASYERLVDAAESLLGINQTPLPVGNSQRDALYQALYGVQASSAFTSLSGKVRLDPSSTNLAAKARTDFSSLTSLLALSPIVLTATDAANKSLLDTVLQSTWSQTYNDWLADSNMTLADRQAGKQTFSDEWITDRAHLLNAVSIQSQADTTSGQVTDASVPTDRQYEFRYFGGTPRQGETQPPLQNLIAVSALSATSKPQFIFFADEGNNQVDGTTNQLDDHLYGGAGNDVVNGLSGADYLEGNAGADSLDGGEGADRLLGNTGADTLDGGTGSSNDTLNGGADADLYIVGKDAGVDTLASSDAADRLQLGTRTLDGSGTFVSSSNGVTVWRDSSVSTDVITYSMDTASQVLTVKGANSVVRVKDFVSGDLGISEPVAPAPPPPPATSSFNDFSLSAAQPSVSWPTGEWTNPASAQANHLVNFNSWFVGSYPNLLSIDAKANDDWIEGGAGTNTNLKLIKAGSGDDQVYASTTQTLADAVAAQEVAVATGRSDLLLDGGHGNDSVFGAAGDDALFGGDGADTIAGGAGTDVIFSDGDSGLQDSELNQQSTAGFRWVAGSNAGGSWIYFNGLSFTASPGSSPNAPASNERTYTCAA